MYFTIGVFYLLPLASIGLYFVSLHYYLKALEKHDPDLWDSLGRPTFRKLRFVNTFMVAKSLVRNTYKRNGANEILICAFFTKVAFILTLLVFLLLPAFAPEGVYS